MRASHFCTEKIMKFKKFPEVNLGTCFAWTNNHKPVRDKQTDFNPDDWLIINWSINLWLIRQKPQGSQFIRTEIFNTFSDWDSDFRLWYITSTCTLMHHRLAIARGWLVRATPHMRIFHLQPSVYRSNPHAPPGHAALSVCPYGAFCGGDVGHIQPTNVYFCRHHLSSNTCPNGDEQAFVEVTAPCRVPEDGEGGGVGVTRGNVRSSVIVRVREVQREAWRVTPAMARASYNGTKCWIFKNISSRSVPSLGSPWRSLS